jgi:hypothetical protein
MQRQGWSLTTSSLSCVLLLWLLLTGHRNTCTAADVAAVVAATLPVNALSTATNDISSPSPGVQDGTFGEVAGLYVQSMSCWEELSSAQTSCGSLPSSSLPLLVTSTSSFIVLNAKFDGSGIAVSLPTVSCSTSSTCSATCTGCTTSCRSHHSQHHLVQVDCNSSMFVQDCDCTVRVAEQLLNTRDGSHTAARAAHATLLPINTLDLEDVLPGAYTICFLCDATCSAQPAGFRLSHALPPDFCSALAANVSAAVGQAAFAEVSEGRSPAGAAAVDAQWAMHAPPQLLQYEVQLSTPPPNELHAANSSNMPDDSGSSCSGGHHGDSGVSSAVPAAAASSYIVWLLRLLALALSSLLMLAPCGTLQRIRAVRQLQQVLSVEAMHCVDALSIMTTLICILAVQGNSLP